MESCNMAVISFKENSPWQKFTAHRHGFQGYLLLVIVPFLISIRIGHNLDYPLEYLGTSTIKTE